MDGVSRTTGSDQSMTLEKALEGLDFPASKEEIILHLEDQNAPPEVLNMLSESLTNDTYNSVSDVTAGVGQVV